jgi:hypothetical protein
MAELVGLSHSLQLIAALEFSHGQDPEGVATSRGQGVFEVRVFPDMVPKLGLLEPDTIRSVIAAHNEVEAYRRALLDYFRHHTIPDPGLNEKAVDIIRKAIADLARATG